MPGDSGTSGDDQRRRRDVSWPVLLALVAVMVSLNVLVVALVPNDRPVRARIPYSPLFLDQVRAGNVASISSQGETVQGQLKREITVPKAVGEAKVTTQLFSTEVPTFANDTELADLLERQQVEVNAKPPDTGRSFLETVLLSLLPALLLLAVIVFVLRRMSGAGGTAASAFARSRARRVDPTADAPRITFADVAGIDEAEEELEQIVDFLRDPDKYRRLGARIPRGVLLTGPPGTGKTLLARALAGEAQVPFFSISASEFVELYVGVGGVGGRQILDVHVRSVPLAADVDLDRLAAATTGMVGADLANVINEGALLAARRGHPQVEMGDLEEALEKLILGAERRIVLSPEDRRRSAYHEAGHAIAGLLTPGADPVRKVSIVPHGESLGATLSVPQADRFSYDRGYLEAKIRVALGGRVAEELVFDEVSTGAQADIKQVTEVARDMVGAWGMSDRIGPILVLAGNDLSWHPVDGSPDTARVVDEEIHRIVEDALDAVRALLRDNRARLDAVAAALLEHETLDEDAIRAAAGLPPAPPPAGVATIAG